MDPIHRPVTEPVDLGPATEEPLLRLAPKPGAGDRRRRAGGLCCVAVPFPTVTTGSTVSGRFLLDTERVPQNASTLDLGKVHLKI